MARFYLGITGPRRKILGMSVAGDIEAVGNNVTAFKQGNAVYASTFGCGFGGYAEYKCMPEKSMLFSKPLNISYEEAAAIPGGANMALRFLRLAQVKQGQKVLIYGASGAIGTYAVQLAEVYGAHVTGVCSSDNLDMVRSLGADHVIDYTREDFTAGTRRYDVVFDAVHKLNRAQGQKILAPKGRYFDAHQGHDGEKKAEYHYLNELLEAEKLKPYIDQVYPLEQIVAAHHYVDKGHKRGNVVVTI